MGRLLEIDQRGRNFPLPPQRCRKAATRPAGVNLDWFTVTGPATLPSIVNSTDGLTLTFNLTLSASDVLVIDLATRNVTVNGANARFSLIEPNWWLFNPGSTFVIFGGQSGSGTMVISYRNAWR